MQSPVTCGKVSVLAVAYCGVPAIVETATCRFVSGSYEQYLTFLSSPSGATFLERTDRICKGFMYNLL